MKESDDDGDSEASIKLFIFIALLCQTNEFEISVDFHGIVHSPQTQRQLTSTVMYTTFVPADRRQISFHDVINLPPSS